MQIGPLALPRHPGNQPADPDGHVDLTLPLDPVAEGYRAMDERRAIKALLRP